MDGFGKWTVLAAIIAALFLAERSDRAAAEPVTLRLGYGAAAEEPLWLIVAKPELTYSCLLYTSDAADE